MSPTPPQQITSMKTTSTMPRTVPKSMDTVLRQQHPTARPKGMFFSNKKHPAEAPDRGYRPTATAIWNAGGGGRQFNVVGGPWPGPRPILFFSHQHPLRRGSDLIGRANYTRSKLDRQIRFAGRRNEVWLPLEDESSTLALAHKVKTFGSERQAGTSR